MKVKQIAWDKSYLYGGEWEVFYTLLPLCHSAKITNTPNTNRWELACHNTIIVSGDEPTLEEAKEACQEAWEALLMGAMEKAY